MLLVSRPVWAGQVVTDDDRRWAKNALAQEQAIQPAPNTLAVLYFHNRTGQPQLDPLQKGFACMLMTDLAAVENLHLVERARLQALVEELDLGATGLVERQTAPRVGKLLGASYLVGGDLSAPGAETIGIDANLLEVSDQRTLGQPVTQGRLAQIFDLEKKILFDLIELLKIRLTPQQRERLEQPLTRNYQALLLLSSGLEASDRGNY
ncbi:MAG: CsgG/HfaB family protein, partial [Syntrophaceae bacterium]